MKNFECNYEGASTAFALSVGGDAVLQHGLYNRGGVEAGGDVYLDYAYSDGDVRAGGRVVIGSWIDTDPANVDIPGATVGGSVFAQGGGSLDSFHITDDLVTSGTMTTINGSISGSVFNTTSGDLTMRNGAVTGDVNSAGALDLDGTVTVSGSVNTGLSTPDYVYTPLVDHSAASDYYLATSSSLGAMADTGAVATTNGSGLITINCVSGVNVVNLTWDDPAGAVHALDYLAAWGVEVNGPWDAVLYVNVWLDSADTAAVFDDVVWWTNGGLARANIVVNFPNATDIEFSGYHEANMLMPLADVNFTSGIVIGNLITGNLIGGGQVNVPVVTPEPATLALLATGLAGLAAVRRRRKKNMA